MKRLALIVFGVAALASFNATAQSPQPQRVRMRPRRSPKTSRRSCSTSARPAIGPAKWRRCRCCRTRTRGRGPRRSRPKWSRARCRPGAPTRRRRLPMRNDISLSQKEIDTIAAWVDGGAAKGNAADMPPAPKFADGLDARHASPISSSRCRSSSTFPPKASSACRCSIRRCRGTRIASPRSSSCKPSNRAVLHHAGIFFVDIPEGATLVDGRIVDKDGKVIGDRGSRGLPSTDSGLPGSSKLLSWVPGRGLDHHRANIGKRIPAGKYINWQLHYNPIGKPEKDRTQARHLVQQGAGDARSADPPGGRSAGDDQGRPVDLSRRRPRSGIHGRRGQHAPQPQDAEHPAVRGELAPHRHHAGDRRHHALRDVAAHAPARQEPEVGDRLSRRPRADDPQRAEVRLQLAVQLRAEGAAEDSRRQQDPRASASTTTRSATSGTPARTSRCSGRSRAGTRCTSRSPSTRSTRRTSPC